ncbi:MAG: hypothetical protein H7330_03900 [Hymenobacteraceae bacterium]|nr:hypothetical protein [Hymenobacteraceae bacterium]
MSLLRHLTTHPARARRWVAGVLFASGLIACERTAEVPPALSDAVTGRDFLPIRIGSYWIYDVVDQYWNFNRDSIARFQFRERVDTVFPGANGEQTFRLIRSRRPDSLSQWHDDSVFALVLTPQLVRQTFANRPTVELVFPVRDRATWNPNMFNALDSTERRYVALDQPLTLATGQQFVRTVRVEDAGENNLFYRRENSSVYARAVGRIHRVRRALEFCQLNDSVATRCPIGPGYIVRGQEREETLRAYGPPQ